MWFPYSRRKDVTSCRELQSAREWVLHGGQHADCLGEALGCRWFCEVLDAGILPRTREQWKWTGLGSLHFCPFQGRLFTFAGRAFLQAISGMSAWATLHSQALSVVPLRR